MRNEADILEGSSGAADDLLALATVDPAVLASKRVVFIGALPDEATVTMVRAAMIPFGDIKSVDMVCRCTCQVIIALSDCFY